MRFTSIIILFFLLPFAAFSQFDGLTYQAVILSADGGELPGVDIAEYPFANSEVFLRFTISDHLGEIEFQEAHEAPTDAYGMVSVVLGEGITLSEKEFNQIEWMGQGKALKVEVSFDRTTFSELSEQDLFFVPYGYHRDAIVDGTLLVEDASTLNGTLQVMGATDLQSTLTVTEATVLNSTLTVAESTLLNATLAVEDETTLQNSLDVVGPTTLQSALTVENASPSQFSGTMDASGVANFEDTLNAHSVLNANSLNVASDFGLEGNLSVGGFSSLQGLAVDQGSTFRKQVLIDVPMTTSQNSLSSYPLAVRGANQGMYIKVNGTAKASNNFISFADASGIKGRIEGQTLQELHGHYLFLWDLAMGAFEEAFIVAEGAACLSQLDGWEAAVMAANYVVAGANWVGRTADAELNVGIMFSSGGADYAEWLEKLDVSAKFFPGEVVGVHAGKISKKTEGADHIFAISTNPIVLGNMPKEGEEYRYERIGFLGQVPVRVFGDVALGDYIVASGNNDGFAVAYAPEALPTELYNQILGVAWQAAEGKKAHVINTAIGLNPNALAHKVAKLESDVEELKRLVLNTTNTPALAQTNASDAQDQIEETNHFFAREMASRTNKTASIANEEDFEEWIVQNGQIFENQMSSVRSYLKSENIDYKQYEELQKLIDEPVKALRSMQKGEFMPTLWQNYSNRIKDK